MPYIGNSPGQKDISAYTNIGATPAGSDELLLSDAGVLKAVTVTNLMAASSGGPTTPGSTTDNTITTWSGTGGARVVQGVR